MTKFCYGEAYPIAMDALPAEMRARRQPPSTAPIVCDREAHRIGGVRMGEPAFRVAVDAAPPASPSQPEGTSMNQADVELCLKYLIDKLDPASKDELAEMMGGRLPDLGQDAMASGGVAWDRLPARIKQRTVREAVQPTVKAAKPDLPHMNRLK